MDTFRSSRALGILYAEDFGAEIQDEPTLSEAPPAPPPPPELTQADLDAACIQAVQAAQASWSNGAEQRRAELLATIAASLAASHASAAEHAEAVADGVARAALGMVAGALPHLCRAHGDQEVRVLMQRLAPVLAPRARLVVRVHAGLIDTLRNDLETLDDTLIANIELRPANLQPGDVRLSWEDGSLVRDTAAIRGAMEESLAQLGLLDPAPAPGVPTLVSDRSLALAQ